MPRYDRHHNQRHEDHRHPPFTSLKLPSAFSLQTACTEAETMLEQRMPWKAIALLSSLSTTTLSTRESFRLHRLLAAAYADDGQLDAATSAFKSAQTFCVENSPEYVRLHLDRARSLLSFGSANAILVASSLLFEMQANSEALDGATQSQRLMRERMNLYFTSINIQRSLFRSQLDFSTLVQQPRADSIVWSSNPSEREEQQFLYWLPSFVFHRDPPTDLTQLSFETLNPIALARFKFREYLGAIRIRDAVVGETRRAELIDLARSAASSGHSDAGIHHALLSDAARIARICIFHKLNSLCEVAVNCYLSIFPVGTRPLSRGQTILLGEALLSSGVARAAAPLDHGASISRRKLAKEVLQHLPPDHSLYRLALSELCQELCSGHRWTELLDTIREARSRGAPLPPSFFIQEALALDGVRDIEAASLAWHEAAMAAFAVGNTGYYVTCELNSISRGASRGALEQLSILRDSMSEDLRSQFAGDFAVVEVDLYRRLDRYEDISPALLQRLRVARTSTGLAIIISVAAHRGDTSLILECGRELVEVLGSPAEHLEAARSENMFEALSEYLEAVDDVLSCVPDGAMRLTEICTCLEALLHTWENSGVHPTLITAEYYSILSTLLRRRGLSMRSSAADEAAEQIRLTLNATDK